VSDEVTDDEADGGTDIGTDKGVNHGVAPFAVGERANTGGPTHGDIGVPRSGDERRAACVTLTVREAASTGIDAAHSFGVEAWRLDMCHGASRWHRKALERL
jgi:hypothetical protein